MTKKIFSPLLLLFIVSLFISACKNPCLTFAEDFQFQLKDSTNADLLNPATAHAIDTATVKIAMNDGTGKVYLKRFFNQINNINTIQVPDMVWNSINKDAEFWVETPQDAGIDTDTIRMRVNEVVKEKCMSYEYGEVLINGQIVQKEADIFVLKK